MLRTRLVLGTVLVVLTIGLLLLDEQLSPWYPCLFFLVLGLSLAACAEMLGLLGPDRPAQVGLCYLGVAAMALATWAGHLVFPASASAALASVFAAFVAVVMASFLVEMAVFREPGQSLERMARSVWMVGYLGLLPSFLAQLRWLGGSEKPAMGTAALALAILVPKTCDIGAYFSGRWLGKHRLAPVLSPKKTWEGAAGGLLLAMAVAVILDRLGPAPSLRGEWLVEMGFGFSVGLAGMAGDLAESLLKRDCQKKDASQVVPGFGGILDVVDALLFAAPVAFLWFVVLSGL